MGRTDELFGGLRLTAAMAELAVWRPADVRREDP